MNDIDFKAVVTGSSAAMSALIDAIHGSNGDDAATLLLNLISAAQRDVADDIEADLRGLEGPDDDDEATAVDAADYVADTYGSNAV